MRCQTLRGCGPTLKRLKRDLDSTKPVESRELHPQRGILEGNRLVAVQQESNEVNEIQQKVCHGAQIVTSIDFTVKVLSADGIMAMPGCRHRSPPSPARLLRRRRLLFRATLS